MSLIDLADKAALSMFLRSKTALGRLTDAEVHEVIGFLEGIGFVHHAPVAAPAEPAPVIPMIAPPPAQ